MNKKMLLLLLCFLVQFAFVQKIQAKKSLTEVTSTREVRTVVVKPILLKINEVLLERGQQKYIYFRIKYATNRIRIGKQGFILNGSKTGKVIGKFKIISIIRNYVKANIIELTDTVASTAFIRIN